MLGHEIDKGVTKLQPDLLSEDVLALYYYGLEEEQPLTALSLRTAFAIDCHFRE